MQILKGHTGRVFSVDFSEDNKQIVSGSEDNTTMVMKQMKFGLKLFEFRTYGSFGTFFLDLGPRFRQGPESTGRSY